MKRKEEAIDLLSLYVQSDTGKWNKFLALCLAKHDVKTLMRVRYQLQAGMADLSKKKLNTEKMILWFIRLQNSIENTIKQIVREKDPNPCDRPLLAIKNIEYQEAKRARDHNLELELKRTGY